INASINFLSPPDENGKFEIKVEIEARYDIELVKINMRYNNDIITIDRRPHSSKGTFKAGEKIVKKLKGSVKFIKDAPPAYIILDLDYSLPYDDIIKDSIKRHGEQSRIFKNIKNDLDRDKGKVLKIKPALLVRALKPKAAKPGEITEIRLERTQCFGTCPAYVVTLRNNGPAEYLGTAYVESTGRRSGTVATFYFTMLQSMLNEMGFFELKNNYSKNATDLPSTITTVRRGSTTKTIKNYGNAGPTKLWAIEMAIDAVTAKIKWQEEAGKQL
ncbi:MAG: DUF6438 domain-containing protein, partial [Thermodesulfobacteriota bacterium]